MRRFGPAWNAPICDGTIPVEIPVGERCLDCGEPIGPDDRGFIHPVVRADGTATIRPIHRECSYLGVMGHRHGYCGCTDYQGLTRRMAALVMWSELMGPD